MVYCVVRNVPSSPPKVVQSPYILYYIQIAAVHYTLSDGIIRLRSGSGITSR